MIRGLSAGLAAVAWMTTAAVAEQREDLVSIARALSRATAAENATVGARALARKAGTVVFHVTLLRASADVPANVAPRCTGSISNFNDTQFLFLTASKTVRSTATATGATCTIAVPFDWAKAESTVGIQPDVGFVIVNGTDTVPGSVGSQGLSPVPFPALDGVIHLNATFRY